MANGNQKEYVALQDDISHALIIGVLPIMALFFLMADYVVLIVGGEGFMASAAPLRMLCFAAIPAVFACYVTSAILLPNKGERLNLKATIAGAVTNLVSNFFVIPVFGIVGAAFTTLLAEAVVLMYSSVLAKPYCDWSHVFSVQIRPLCTALVSVLAMTVVYAVTRSMLDLDIIGFFATGFALTFTALASMLLLRDEMLIGFLKKVLVKS